ncbi:hypothetical protein PDO_1148 [Rhizobium sp. PDO1-076]|jgi:hypothetical protein|nr:hypothetical protein [Rhizobium sp. PDO1-076]EHS53185.1 hypothetical protein PDO_1148 [Rhizobium sp. PDO1-076]
MRARYKAVEEFAGAHHAIFLGSTGTDAACGKRAVTRRSWMN